VDHESGRGDGVLDRHRRHPQLADPRLRLFRQGPESEHRLARRRDVGEVGPQHVIERVGAEGLDHRGDAGRDHPTIGRDHRQGIGQECEAGCVVQVGVGQEGVLDLDLLGDRERAAHGAGVDQDPIVD
jgi:hypothetical protein